MLTTAAAVRRWAGHGARSPGRRVGAGSRWRAVRRRVASPWSDGRDLRGREKPECRANRETGSKIKNPRARLYLENHESYATFKVYKALFNFLCGVSRLNRARCGVRIWYKCRAKIHPTSHVNRLGPVRLRPELYTRPTLQRQLYPPGFELRDSTRRQAGRPRVL